MIRDYRDVMSSTQKSGAHLSEGGGDGKKLLVMNTIVDLGQGQLAGVEGH